MDELDLLYLYATPDDALIDDALIAAVHFSYTAKGNDAPAPAMRRSSAEAAWMTKPRRRGTPIVRVAVGGLSQQPTCGLAGRLPGSSTGADCGPTQAASIERMHGLFGH